MERVFNRPFSNGPLPSNLIIAMRKQVATGNGEPRWATTRMCQLLIDRKSGPCHFCSSAEDVTHLFLQSPTNKSAQLQSPASDRICGNERNSEVFHQVDESDADIGAAPLIFPFGLAEELLLRVKFLLRIGALSFFFLCNSFCTLIFAVFRVSPLFLPPMALLI